MRGFIHLFVIGLSLSLVCSCRSGKDSTSGETPTVISLLIGPEKVDCIGEGPQLCYLVREDEDAEWRNFYGEIADFTYQAGYNYEILVEKIKIPKPMADGPAFRYRMLKVLQKQKTTGSILHDIWVVQALEGNKLKQVQSRPRLELMPSQERMIGFTGCNELNSRLKVAALRITFDEISLTERYCEGFMETERTFVRALERVDRYEVRNLELILFAGEVEMVRLRKVD